MPTHMASMCCRPIDADSRSELLVLAKEHGWVHLLEARRLRHAQEAPVVLAEAEAALGVQHLTAQTSQPFIFSADGSDPAAHASGSTQQCEGVQVMSRPRRCAGKCGCEQSSRSQGARETAVGSVRGRVRGVRSRR